MSYVSTNRPINDAGNPLDWFLSMMKGWRTSYVAEQPVSRALKELEALEDYQLADIGLARSELTADGLAAAGARRARKQVQIDRACKVRKEVA